MVCPRGAPELGAETNRRNASETPAGKPRRPCDASMTCREWLGDGQIRGILGAARIEQGSDPVIASVACRILKVG